MPTLQQSHEICRISKVKARNDTANAPSSPVSKPVRVLGRTVIIDDDSNNITGSVGRHDSRNSNALPAATKAILQSILDNKSSWAIDSIHEMLEASEATSAHQDSFVDGPPECPDEESSEEEGRAQKNPRFIRIEDIVYEGASA